MELQVELLKLVLQHRELITRMHHRDHPLKEAIAVLDNKKKHVEKAIRL